MTIARRWSVTLEQCALATLVLLGLSFGLGDIAQVTPLDVVILNGVHGLLPLSIGLTMLAVVASGRKPAFPGLVLLPLAAWLVAELLSAALAPTNRADALAAVERPIAGALLAWSTCVVCRTRDRWLVVARALALGGLAIALIGLAEASGIPAFHDWLASVHDGGMPIGDVVRITATLSHPNVAAILLELSLPLLIAWTWTAERAWRVPLALATLATLMAMVLTFSRAGIVAGVAALAVMAGLSLARGDRRRVLSLALLALAVPATLVCAAMTDPGLDRRLTAELTTLSPQTSPTSLQPTRYEYWRVAGDMFRTYPLLGVGPDNYRWRFASYAGITADNLGIHAHNEYLEALADTGLLGLLSLGWLLICLVRAAIKGTRSQTTRAEDWPWRAALLASLSAWLLHALLDDFDRFWPASVAFWLIAGLSLNQPATPTRASPRPSTREVQRLNSQKTPATTTTRTSSTRMPPGLCRAAPPPPPPPKLTMPQIVRPRARQFKL